MPAVTIDGRTFEAKEGETILDVARANDIYIPTLCNHPDLSPYGGCRMCLVQVEGMRNYVPACSTPVTDGMVVRTSEEGLDDLRRQILELILSEHPSACIVCVDREECFRYHPEPTKAGRVTGCRFCPNRDHCDLYDVVEYLGVRDIRVDVEYREQPLFRADPFIQRDYNLCILCGRCVRVCDEIRGAGAIAFLFRSHDATVGTAFQGPLLEAGCIFCGACEDVCPTGAIASKMTRWVGLPDETAEGTCVMCPAGCTMEMEFKWERFTFARPSREGVNVHQACMKGRYCSVPLTNSRDRLEYPLVMADGDQRPVGWEEAIAAAVEVLRSFEPSEVGFVVSPSLTTEEAFLVQHIARGLGSDNIAIASNMAGPVQRAWSEAMDRVAGIGRMADLRECDVVLVVGTDLSLTAPVALVHIHAARNAGARVFDVIHRPRHTYRHAEVIVPEDYVAFMETVLEETRSPGQHPHGPERDRAATIAAALREAERVGILVGPSAFHDASAGERVARLALEIFEAVNGAVILPLWDGGNVQGALVAGATRCLLPGQCRGPEGEGMIPGSDPLGGGMRALFLTEPVPRLPDGVEFVVYMGPFREPTVDSAHVVLPTTLFSETEGTVISMDGRVGRVATHARPPGMARRDIDVLLDLAAGLGLDVPADGPEGVRRMMGLDLGPGDHLPTPTLLPTEAWGLRPAESTNPQGPWPCAATHYRGHDITGDVEDLLEVVVHWRWDE